VVSDGAWIINTSVFKLITILVAGFVICSPAFGQAYKGKNGKVKFFSEAPLETLRLSRMKQILFQSHNRRSCRPYSNQVFVFDKTLMRDILMKPTWSQTNTRRHIVGKLEGGIPENVTVDKVVTVSES